MTRRERSELIDGLIDGALPESDFLRIEAELSVNPAARREYYDRLALGAMLEAEARTFGPALIDRSASSFWRKTRWIAAGMAAAAALSLATLGGYLSKSTEAPIVASAVEQNARGFGLLVGESDTIWSHAEAMRVGALLPAGPLRLDSGIAQIELFSGVSLVVEGAAEFEIVSPMQMIVSSGRIRARVPEAAHGFQLQSPDGQVVDLGTEFAVNVADGRSEVHVFDGEVEWHPQNAAMHHLGQGQALSWDESSTLIDRPADEQGFIGVDEFTARLVQDRTSRREHWLQFSARLQHDPRLVAYYRMAAPQQWSRRLDNRATSEVVGEGAVVGAAPASDRWGNAAQALDFSPTGSRVRVVVPGEYRSLTLMTWVKINSLDRWYNSLFLTDGHELHEPHWQIMDDGRMFFSVKKREGVDRTKGERDKHIYFSPPFWHQSLSGQWLMLATVYDVDQRRVTHYLNGAPLSRETMPEDYVVENVNIGAASIGNWDLPIREDPHFAVRNLNGSMDEFALFSAPLTDEEIAEIYAHGKP